MFLFQISDALKIIRQHFKYLSDKLGITPVFP